MSKPKYFQIPTQDAVAAAVCAFRMFGDRIVRDSSLNNKNALLDHFNGAKALPITAQDQENAEIIISGLAQHILMLQLADRTIPTFTEDVNILCQKPTTSTKYLGLVVWAPKLHDDIVKSNTIRESIQCIGITSSYVGTVRQKIEINFTPLHTHYVPDYNSWIHTGHDGHGNLINFWRGEQVAGPAKISGRVKAHQLSSRYNNVKVTVLNYVKVL